MSSSNHADERMFSIPLKYSDVEAIRNLLTALANVDTAYLLRLLTVVSSGQHFQFSACKPTDIQITVMEEESPPTSPVLFAIARVPSPDSPNPIEPDSLSSLFHIHPVELGAQIEE
jgi:hypothetical protein